MQKSKHLDWRLVGACQCPLKGMGLCRQGSRRFFVAFPTPFLYVRILENV